MEKYRTIAVAALALIASATNALAEEATAPAPPRLTWSFSGLFGKYDQGQLQRGFKIYREVCANCHSLDLVAIRTLADSGGPAFSTAQVAALASEYKFKDIGDTGEQIERAGRPADRFPSPFPNEMAARAANGGVAPPDMSTLAKARGYSRGFPWFVLDAFSQYQEQGPDYIAALLMGYTDAPANSKVQPGGYYNIYCPGHVSAMPPPLQARQVAFDDDAPQTIQQYSKDIAAFLMWAAEPHLVARKRIGFQATIFLIVLALLLYFTKRRVWSAVLAPHAPTE
jgi:ubiquinol-cytochrome c reductase cytochrome b/c1 subunit